MKPLRVGAMVIASLLLAAAACGPRRPFTFWVPGIYQYRGTLPSSGDVTGTIEVVAEGPLNVTSSVGACRARIETSPRRFRERIDGELLVRSFICGTDHRISVVLGRDGTPPIEGSISNQRTDKLTTYGETTCREYQTIDSGERIERICVAWNWGPKIETRTTGSSARWYLVADSLAPQP